MKQLIKGKLFYRAIDGKLVAMVKLFSNGREITLERYNELYGDDKDGY